MNLHLDDENSDRVLCVRMPPRGFLRRTSAQENSTSLRRWQRMDRAMRIPRGSLPKFALAAVLIAVPIHSAQTQSTGPIVPGARTEPTHATGERLVRSWRDTVKIHGRDQARTIEIVYDYDDAVALRRTYDADGVLLFEQVLGSQPQPSEEEIAEAFAMVRDDAALGALFRRAGAHLDGGFILDEVEGEPCGRGTRCLQVFMLSQSRWGLLRHSAIDLRNRRIAHRSLRAGRTERR